MGRPGPQVNFQFSVKPEGGLEIAGYDVFENGEKIENPPEDEPYGGSDSPLQYFASAALYDLFYISQTLHGPIHVLHYVLTNALKWASEDSDYGRLNKWAVDYHSTVNTKYAAVTSVLIALGGNGLLTSANGLGGCDASLPVMKENIEAWGACSTVRRHRYDVAAINTTSSTQPVHILTTYHLPPTYGRRPSSTTPGSRAPGRTSRPRACSPSTSSTRTSARQPRSPRPRPSRRRRTSSPPRTRSFATTSTRAARGPSRRTASRRCAPCSTSCSSPASSTAAPSR